MLLWGRSVGASDDYSYHRSLVPQPRASLRLDLGAASALGFIGAAASYYPAPWLVLEGGVGYGLTGVQTSGMVKLAYGSDSLRLLAGAGVAAGIGGTGDANPDALSDTVYWLNVDLVGAEYRSPARFVFMFALGFTMGLFGPDLCAWETCKHARDFVAPQFRVGLGHWF
jgi:hypothetical protein